MIAWHSNTQFDCSKLGPVVCTIDLLFDSFGISCMTTDNFCFYLQNRLIQTSQTGGQWYSDTSPFSIPCLYHKKSYERNETLKCLTLTNIYTLVYYLQVRLGPGNRAVEHAVLHSCIALPY
jgi:hypothetical protein